MFCHPIRCILLAHIDRDMCHTRSLYHNHHLSLAGATSSGARDSEAAVRRRQPRLRAQLRHEQQSVAMALAAAQHHSDPKSAGPETYVALRDRTLPRQGGGRES